jgi:hypothetical protein
MPVMPHARSGNDDPRRPLTILGGLAVFERALIARTTEAVSAKAPGCDRRSRRPTGVGRRSTGSRGKPSRSSAHVRGGSANLYRLTSNAKLEPRAGSCRL